MNKIKIKNKLIKMLNYNSYSKCIIENAKTLLIEHIKYVLIRIRDLHYDRSIVIENEENKSFEILIDKSIYDVSKNDYTANKIMVNDNGDITILSNTVNADIKEYNLEELSKLSDILDYML